ncbi:G-protein alpha subunit [Laetiporus sulphureus 93-53]|uniref:G-protein alpha subunit n=1 Tax=Laetiporus sulphureus 93-53 TaxID=1314785 RepID=A0A165CDM2_9APHY|nr:G-protein alpha subunit [Laetiporus sulphureus 93-53]KZT02620.1 G-protein alpha subunit [Laetiporus sulphureus 93-53]
MIRTSRPPSVHSTATDLGDPLSAILRPPPTETDRDRLLRLQREEEAKRISDSIDEEIRLDRERYKKSKEDVKLLLLGQAESGKSTLQKQFQLIYNPTSLEEERLSWRVVIYYNIVRPVLRILEALDVYGDEVESDDDSDKGRSAQVIVHASASQASLPPPSPSPSVEQRLSALRLCLSPLSSVEASLANRLSDGVAVSGSGKGSVMVRSGWQARAFGLSFGKARERTSSAKGRFSFTGQRKVERDKLVEDVANLLNACKDDIRELWGHAVVKRLRENRKLRLEEWAEYFLNNIERVSSPGYVPTIDDILHARIQTMGVAEHIFDVPLHGRNVTWHLYDVGGARGQRHTWVPYFDDATAIIFLAPVSAFDQYLSEDPRTNRVDDSLQLFKQICSNQLLKNAHLVLFLNKVDVLATKLARGVQVKKYITSYGDRPNEVDAVVGYFKAHFTQVHTRNNENKRVLYTHLTSVVDTKAMQSIISNVRDSIFRDYLKKAALV